VNQKVFLKPAEGLVVRDPDNLSQVLPAEGKEVILTTGWKRYIRFGDVYIVNSTEKTKKDGK
jgi:hypothetical protein